MARDGSMGRKVLMRPARAVRGLALFVISLAAITVAALARAQTTPESTPELTEEQLQILQDLPAEERQALIEQYLGLAVRVLSRPPAVNGGRPRPRAEGPRAIR